MADLEGRNGQRKEFRVVGKPNLPGRLSYALATSKAKFGIDYAVPDMLHAKFLRSPYANAKVTGVDTGKIMRRTSLESQVHQVVFCSERCQRYEVCFFDEKTGVKLNANMFDYKKPTILDNAPVDMDLLETRAGNAAYGANGISHSLANTHLVISAIYNAIGKRVDPPATPDKILVALGKA